MKTPIRWVASSLTRRARWKFAGELDISVSTARRHLEVLVAVGAPQCGLGSHSATWGE